MPTYYNDNESYAAAWLRNLIAAGLIPAGDVDERPIQEVMPDDIRHYTQCHFFAGIGGWACALRLAGVADLACWTGSCPCQPFSAAGKREGFADPRHLWPEWFRLIRECRPPVIFGEQVAGAIKGGWLDAVYSDLEAEGYSLGSAVLPACGVGAPHIRQRLWFVADASSARRDEAREHGSGATLQPARPTEHGRTCELADANAAGRSEQWSGGLFDGERPALRDDTDGRGPSGLAHANGRHPSPEGLQRGGEYGQRAEDGGAGELGDAEHSGLETRQPFGQGANAALPSGPPGFWSDCDWLPCTDGKARPVEPGSFPLAHGVQRRASKLRAYGNAIVPQAAAEFIKAFVAT